MKFENHIFTPNKESYLEKILNDQADINQDLHSDEDSEMEKARKDMQLFLRKPFCCK